MALITRKDTIGSKRIYDGNIISLRIDSVSMPDGSPKTREIVEHNGGVVIACQPTASEIILIKQYRYAIDKEILELPAGRVEIAEDPFVCAQRELIEETGYKAEQWEKIAQIYSAPGFCDELLRIYKATNISFVGKSLDEDEETEVIVLSVKAAWQAVTTAEFADAKTVAGLGLILNNSLL